MSGILQYEWRRATSLRSTWVVLVLSGGCAAVLGFLLTRLGAETVGTSTTTGGVLTIYTALGVVFASVLAAQAIGHEYRYGMIRLTLTAFPRRGQVAIAKIVAVTVAAAVLAVSGSALGWAGALVGGPDRVAASDAVAAQAVRALLYVVLYALVALAIAGITRSLPVGVVVPLLLGYVVEPLLTSLLTWDWLADVLPFSNGAAAASDGAGGWRSLAVFAGWTVVALAGWVASLQTRDA
ncbi:MAG: hypothetical protein EPO13_10140 [Actinomycetota bacterium]|nr:MAG: hypothetical protein EPO13_10140 [Actinomycetota bacterium]